MTDPDHCLKLNVRSRLMFLRLILDSLLTDMKSGFACVSQNHSAEQSDVANTKIL
jgi:hypothetical protein